MPHTPSAKKRLRQYAKRRQRNRVGMKDIKDQLKKFSATATEGTVEQLRAEYKLAAKKLDKAASKRLVHPNLAARKKSQLARQLLAKEKGGAAK